jgi:nitrite reductase (NADH) large subunit
MNDRSRWTHVCALDDILADTGVCARVAAHQVAIFLVRDAVHAIGNYDPASGVNVLARGIVGDLGGEIVVASPIYKQHYSLISGRCLEDADLSVPVFMTRVVSGQVWVRNAPMALSRPAGPRRLVMVGCGMAGTRLIEELLERAPAAYEITVFGAEPAGGYNRVLLSPLLAGDKGRGDVITHPPAWFEQRGVKLHAADPIEHIDRVRRVVHAASGLAAPYDRLVIATGSTPNLLSIPGTGLPGVRTFRDLEDVDAMLVASSHHPRAVVVGAGLLGLEAASGLLRRGMTVAVVHRGNTLMNRQLDEAGSALLLEQLLAQGLAFRLGTELTEIVGEERVTGVRLADGSELAADLVVIAIGTRPNIALAESAGLRCERGILVDDTLQSFDPAIYAIGECVQHREQTFGLVAPLMEQASVCAAHLAEQGRSRYLGSKPHTQLQVAGIAVFSAGDVEVGPDAEALVLRDPSRGVYKKLVVRGQQLAGAVLVGDLADSGWYVDLIREARNVAPLRDRLLFGPAPGDQRA